MDAGFLAVQALNGLATASSLFLVASGLSIVFGISRIVNFAHGSLYMLGAYLAWSLVQALGGRLGLNLGFWGAMLLAAGAVGAIGLLMETLVLRRLYQAPEMLQLLATFGIVLIIEDAVLWIWGPEDLLGPRAPGLAGTVMILGRAVPEFDLFLIALGPLVLMGLWALFRTTRWGVLVRAATLDREMASALGVNVPLLFTGVFVLGAALAGLGGALQLPREAVHHGLGLGIIAEVFVVVVIGGMGSILGAYLAAILIGELHAFGIVVFPGITVVLVFLIMAAVLSVRPWGLLGRPETTVRPGSLAQALPLAPWSRQGRIAAVIVFIALLAAPFILGSYHLGVLTEILIFALFAASLQFIMGVGGLVSFGHAAYFGLGAYGAALLVARFAWPMEIALLLAPSLAVAGAIVYGWFCVRLAGVYLAMLTLAVAQMTYAFVFQSYGITGGDNGILGVWPAGWASSPAVFYGLALGVVALALAALRAVVFAPFGYTLRAGRDSALRAAALGINVRHHQWLAFALAGGFAGVAGALYAFFKGSVFPTVVSIPLSVDALAMVLLGGLQTLVGPVLGAGVYQAVQLLVSGYTEHWRFALGVLIVVLVILAPEGVAGTAIRAARRLGKAS
ncbi:MAG: ABC transporter permease [Alphaproteobacteria bacterium]